MDDQNKKASLHDKKRLVVVAFCMFCFFCFLICQFFKIQILEGDHWLKKARAQHQFIIKEPFKRGRFFTAGNISSVHNDKEIALTVDLPMFHLYIDPNSIPEEIKSQAIESLLPHLGLENDQKAKDQFFMKSRSRKLAMWIEKEKKEEIEGVWKAFSKKNKLPSNSIYFVQDYKRSYPYGKMLGQVLHTIRETKDQETYQAIPTGGLEYYFNKELQGSFGKRRMLRSPKYPLDRGDVIVEPVHGSDVYLTINHHLQIIAEEEIEKAVKKADAKWGWAVVMNPDNGEILALAQYPFFYPEEYRTFFSDKELVETTRVKAITDCFEPGSTLKPISLAIALKANQEYEFYQGEKLFDPEKKVDLTKVTFPGRKVGIKDVAYSKYVNMDIAVQKSSNIYLADLIQKVVDTFGESWYRQQLVDVFGFGKKTGIELPSESPGFLPTPGKYYKSGRPEWSVPTPGCLSIGYNLMVNSIQMMKAYALLANGGYEVNPTLVKKIVSHKSGKEEIIYENKQDETKERKLPKEITKQVIAAMKYSTKPGGTAFRADVPGFTEAGKTSTSEKIVAGKYAKKVHLSSFVGFTPAKDAKLVIMVGIDEPAYRFLPGIGKTHYGGKCAAPVFSEIAKRSLKYMGVTPDDPYGHPLGDPRRNIEKADMTKEVQNLKDLFQKWHGR